MHALGLALAVVVGLSLGLLGGGGSILTVPIFVYVLGFAAKQSIAMSLPVVGATSLVGAIGHWRNGNVHLRLALAFGSVAMAGAFAGAKLATHISGRVQLTLLAITMIAAAVSMFRSGRAPLQARSTRTTASIAVIMAVGLGVGLLTGVVGIGGGFLVVPALVVLAGVPMKQAIGTSLIVIVMNTLSGSLGYIGQFAIPWSFVALFTGLAIAGILIGTHLVRFVSQAALKQGFAGFLVLLGALILIRNRA
jgi:uncharacterized protein